jgi:hypothetical protein
MTATLSRYTLNWVNGTQWENFPELGSIYTDQVSFHTVDNHYRYNLSFFVNDGRQLGLLFVDLESQDCDGYSENRRYCLGQFYTNTGAIKFAKFALAHFIETETWSVCPSFQYVDMIDGDPFTLAGDEIVSEIS